MFRHRSATPAGVTGNGGVRSLGDNVTSILGSAVGARADTATASRSPSSNIGEVAGQLSEEEGTITAAGPRAPAMGPARHLQPSPSAWKRSVTDRGSDPELRV